MKVQATPLVLDALSGAAALLAVAEPQDPEQAVEILAFVLHHPAAEYETRTRASWLQAELTAELPPDMVALAQARGKRLDLHTLVAAIKTCRQLVRG